MAVESCLASWAETVAVPIVGRMLEVPKLTCITGEPRADHAVQVA